MSSSNPDEEMSRRSHHPTLHQRDTPRTVTETDEDVEDRLSEHDGPRGSIRTVWVAVALITLSAVVLGVFAVTLKTPLLFAGLLLGLIGIALALHGRIMDHAE